jgi:hypothetical protein
MGITRPWNNRTHRPPDPAFPCRFPSHLVQISFRSRGLSRTRSHHTYNHHPIRRYPRTPSRLNFRLRIRLSAVSRRQRSSVSSCARLTVISAKCCRCGEVSTGYRSRTTSRRFLRCVLACALALRALVHHALLVHGAGDVGRSLTLGTRILREVVSARPRAMHSTSFLEVVNQLCSSAPRIKNASPAVHRMVSPSRGSAYPSNEPSQPIATRLALVQSAGLQLALRDCRWLAPHLVPCLWIAGTPRKSGPNHRFGSHPGGLSALPSEVETASQESKGWMSRVQRR